MVTGEILEMLTQLTRSNKIAWSRDGEAWRSTIGPYHYVVTQTLLSLEAYGSLSIYSESWKPIRTIEGTGPDRLLQEIEARLKQQEADRLQDVLDSLKAWRWEAG